MSGEKAACIEQENRDWVIPIGLIVSSPLTLFPPLKSDESQPAMTTATQWDWSHLMVQQKEGRADSSKQWGQDGDNQTVRGRDTKAPIWIYLTKGETTSPYLHLGHFLRPKQPIISTFVQRQYIADLLFHTWYWHNNESLANCPLPPKEKWTKTEWMGVYCSSHAGGGGATTRRRGMVVIYLQWCFLLASQKRLSQR